jgi:flagellar biosynthetic protein FliQ
MTQELVITLAREAVELTLLLSLPILIVILVIGLFISFLQAITQIQEMTITFVPKIIATLVLLLLIFPFLMNKLLDYTRNLIVSIPQYIR